MLVLQAVPGAGQDLYKLLRSRIRTANTWTWGNKARTRLKHVQRLKGGFIEIVGARGVLVAHVRATGGSDPFYLAEKFIGRLVAWFATDIASINLQFLPDAPIKKGSKARRRR